MNRKIFFQKCIKNTTFRVYISKWNLYLNEKFVLFVLITILNLSSTKA